MKKKLVGFCNEILNEENTRLLLETSFAMAYQIAVLTAWPENPKVHEELIDDLCDCIREESKKARDHFRASVATSDLLDKFRKEGAQDA